MPSPWLPRARAPGPVGADAVGHHGVLGRPGQHDAAAPVGRDHVADHVDRLGRVQPDPVAGRGRGGQDAGAEVAGRPAGQVQPDVVVVQRDVLGGQGDPGAAGPVHGQAEQPRAARAAGEHQTRVPVAVDGHDRRPAPAVAGRRGAVDRHPAAYRGQRAGQPDRAVDREHDARGRAWPTVVGRGERGPQRARPGAVQGAHDQGARGGGRPGCGCGWRRRGRRGGGTGRGGRRRAPSRRDAGQPGPIPGKPRGPEIPVPAPSGHYSPAPYDRLFAQVSASY